MVVANKMSKSTVKVSVSDSDISSEEHSENETIDNDHSSNTEEESGENLVTNEGWADSLAKILGSNKPKSKKTLVLSRAKKYSETLNNEKLDKAKFEVIGDSKQQLTIGEASLEPEIKKKKIEKPSIRVKPNILEKDRERLLSKIATKGVVQLFNAVRNQQKTIEKQTERTDISETKKEKVLKKFDKRAFLDTLMGQTKSIVVDDQTKVMKKDVKHEDKPKWNVLRDDFMMGAKMKDWDKEVVED